MLGPQGWGFRSWFGHVVPVEATYIRSVLKGQEQRFYLCPWSAESHHNLTMQSQFIIYLRYSCPLCATLTTCLQIAYESLKDNMISPFLVSSWCGQLCSLQRRWLAALCWGPAAHLQPQGCDGAQVPTGLQAFVGGAQQLLCLHCLLQLPISYRYLWLLSFVK